MRITNSIMVGHLMYNLNQNMRRMDKLQMQMSTAMKFQRPSDDPVGITRSLQIRTDLSKIEQYVKNTQNAKAWLNETETALSEMNSIIQKVYENTVKGVNDTMTQKDRQKIAEEIDQMKAQLIQSGNTTYAGRYVFGGYNTTSLPFTIQQAAGVDHVFYNNKQLDDALVDFSVESAEEIRYEVSPGEYMEVSTPGSEVFGTGPLNLYNILDTISAEFRNNPTPAANLAPYVTHLQEKQEHILACMAEVGGKTNRLDLLEKRLGDDILNYETLKGETEGVDYEKTIMDFKMAEAVYRAALSMGASIIQPTLLDFLR